MSYPVDPIGSPFRRDMDSRTSYGHSSATPASGFRSQSWSRTSPASAMTPSFKRSVNTPVARTYGSTVMSYADGVDYGQSVTLNGDYKRSNEKEQLQGLNDRFAGFIDKVHYLEQQNQQIEAEIQALRQKQGSQSQLGNHYDQELQELRSVLEQIHNEKAQIQLDTDHVEEDIQRMQDRLDEEARVREETEAIIRALKKDMNNSELMKSDLEKKVHSLQDEIAFIRNTHEEEVSELLAQVQASHVAVDRKDFQKTDITEALREIRSQLEGHSSQNLQQVEDWFVCRYSKLTEAAEQNKDAIKSARDEIADYRRQLQSKTVELESVRGTRESLERQLNDIEDRHNSDLESLQETIHQLDNELKGTKWEMARHLREYQDLLNVKMALDIEIAAYRKLLEGEESYFSPSPYRQTPTSRKFTPEPARLRVQHKFVDEIVEEIRVEDDTSDLDESLAEVAQELSAKIGDGQQDEEEGAGEEGEDGGEEGEVVAPDDKEEEGGDVKGEGESKKEGEGEEEEEKDGEEGDDGQGEEDDTQKEEGVEETTLSAKAPESKASPEEKKTREGSRTPEEAREEEGGKEEGGDDAGSDKGSKDADAKDEGKEKTGKDAKVEHEKDDKKKTPVTKEEDPKSDPPKPESPESDSPKASSPEAQTPKEAEGKADKKGDATEDKKDDKNDEAKEETDGKDAIVNGVDTSPVKDEPDQKVAITKTAKTLATSEDGAKQVTVTETVKEAEDALQEKLVTSKQTEKQTIQVSKTVTHTE